MDFDHPVGGANFGVGMAKNFSPYVIVIENGIRSFSNH
jgi:hypothetical protein